MLDGEGQASDRDGLGGAKVIGKARRCPSFSGCTGGGTCDVAEVPDAVLWCPGALGSYFLVCPVEG